MCSCVLCVVNSCNWYESIHWLALLHVHYVICCSERRAHNYLLSGAVMGVRIWDHALATPTIKVRWAIIKKQSTRSYRLMGIALGIVCCVFTVVTKHSWFLFVPQQKHEQTHEQEHLGHRRVACILAFVWLRVTCWVLDGNLCIRSFAHTHTFSNC